MFPTSHSDLSRVRTNFFIGRHAEAAADSFGHETPEMLRTRLCPTRHLTVDDLLRLLACIECEGGMATLDSIRDALPDVARPVSGVLDLCDAGILEADFTGRLDGSVQVWCGER